MTPAQLAKSDTEHAHQVALFAYCAVAMRHGFDIADDWCEEGDGYLKGLDPTCDLKIPALEWFHAIPNGGSRGDNTKSRKIRGGQLKAEGVRQGVSDCFLPFPNGPWHGLYIEMKKPSQRPKKETSKGGMSDNQIKFKEYVKSLDYGFMTCYSWEHAVKTLRSYIEWKG